MRRTLGLFVSMTMTVTGAVPLQLAGELERGPSILQMFSSLRSHLQSPAPVADKPRPPQQRDGGPLRAEPATAAATRDDGGAGRAPGKGIGALPPDGPEKRTVRKTVAGAR
ncbi:hypothetical protein, partial [Actinoplanes philippinensis]|uniref:hypothetical protein n=1 Tax=Actinoplanes philippinensis TaxID=35752 RepID=UPI0033DEC1BD